MTPYEINRILDNHFDEHEEYLVTVKDQQGQKKRFLVSVEVQEQIGSAVYEYTNRGGQILDSEQVFLDGEDSDMSLDMDGLVISEHLFAHEGSIDIPIILDLPSPEKTSIENLTKRFSDYAYQEAASSKIEQFDSHNAPDEIDKEMQNAAHTAYLKALSEADNPYLEHMTMEALSNLYVTEYISDRMEKNGGGDAYGDAYYDDSCNIRNFAGWVDGFMEEFGLKTDLEDHLSSSFMEGCMDHDKSSAIDWLDQEVTINFHPTVESNESVTEGMITCNSISGDAYNVVPDEQFKYTLEFLNISGQEFEDILKEVSGGNFVLSRDNEEWRSLVEQEGSLDQWCPKSDPSMGPLVSGSNLVELIENTNGYGTLCWAINVNLKDLLSTPPGEKVKISGGQIGFHDYLNGSGHMESYAEYPKEIDLGKIHLIPDACMRHGIDQVYGMITHAMDGSFEWSESDKQRYLESKKTAYLESLKEIGLPYGDEDIAVQLDEENKAYFTQTNGTKAYIADIYERSKRMYGSFPDLDHLLSNEDKKEIGIKTQRNDYNHNLG